jgi:predicted nucleotidyltransferase
MDMAQTGNGIYPRNREQIIQILRSKASDLEQLGVRHLVLFGSAARDDLTSDSDVDIIVDLSQATYRAYTSVRELLEKALGRPVDLLTEAAVVGRLKEEVDKDLVHVPTY